MYQHDRWRFWLRLILILRSSSVAVYPAQIPSCFLTPTVRRWVLLRLLVFDNQICSLQIWVVIAIAITSQLFWRCEIRLSISISSRSRKCSIKMVSHQELSAVQRFWRAWAQCEPQNMILARDLLADVPQVSQFTSLWYPWRYYIGCWSSEVWSTRWGASSNYSSCAAWYWYSSRYTQYMEYLIALQP